MELERGKMQKCFGHFGNNLHKLHYHKVFNHEHYRHTFTCNHIFFVQMYSITCVLDIKKQPASGGGGVIAVVGPLA